MGGAPTVAVFAAPGARSAPRPRASCEISPGLRRAAEGPGNSGDRSRCQEDNNLFDSHRSGAARSRCVAEMAFARSAVGVVLDPGGCWGCAGEGPGSSGDRSRCQGDNYLFISHRSGAARSRCDAEWPAISGRQGRYSIGGCGRGRGPSSLSAVSNPCL